MPYRLRKLTARLCVISLLLWSFLPLFRAHTVQAAEPFWLEICTARGLERIAAAGNHDPGQPDKTHSADNVHCPLCLLRLTAILPENPARDVIAPVREPATSHAPADCRAPSAETIRPLQPRAPPSIA